MLQENEDIKNLINIYVIFYKPYIQIPSEILTPILCKRDITNENLNILSADTGDNITDENALYSEYSVFYWVWKNNLNSKYVGFFHYRRYLSLKDNVSNQNNFSQVPDYYGWNYDTASNLLKDYDIILPTPHCFTPWNIIEQYSFYHDMSYLEKSMEIIKNKYPDYIEDCSKALISNYGYFCNIFIMRRDIFDDFMSFIMDIFSELKPCLKPDCQHRFFGYLGERLFNCYIEHLKRTTNLRIKIVPRIYIESTGDCEIGWK